MYITPKSRHKKTVTNPINWDFLTKNYIAAVTTASSSSRPMNIDRQPCSGTPCAYAFSDTCRGYRATRRALSRPVRVMLADVQVKNNERWQKRCPFCTRV